MTTSHVDDDGEVSLSRSRENKDRDDEFDFLGGGEDQNEHLVSGDSKLLRRHDTNGLDFWGDSSMAEQKSEAAVPAKSIALEDDLDFLGDVLAEQKSEATAPPAKSVGSSPGDHQSGGDSNIDLKPASKMELYLHVLNATCQVCAFFGAIF